MTRKSKDAPGQSPSRSAAVQEKLAQSLYELCLHEGLLNDIRGWDRAESVELHGGERWHRITVGISPIEKDKWWRVTNRLLDLADRSASEDRTERSEAPHE